MQTLDELNDDDDETKHSFLTGNFHGNLIALLGLSMMLPDDETKHSFLTGNFHGNLIALSGLSMMLPVHLS